MSGEDASKGWLTIAAEWAKHQAATTILLAGVLAFLGYFTLTVAPDHFERIDRNYQKAVSDMDATVDKVLTSQEKVIDKVVAENQKNREAWEKDRAEANKVIIQEQLRKSLGGMMPLLIPNGDG